MNTLEKRKKLTNNLTQITLLYEKYAQIYGLTYNSLTVYYAIEYYGKCTQKQIAEEWAISKQTVNNIVKKGIREGLIEFINNDKKNKLIRFTVEGKKRISKIAKESMLLEEQIISNMGESNVDMLIQGSDSFLDNFKLILENKFNK